MSYDSLVLFETPTLLNDTMTYGLIFNKQKIIDYIDNYMTLEEYINGYVQYLVGANEWLKSGNEISADKQFFIKCSKNYYVNDYYVKKFCKKVYEDNPLKYTVIEECNPIYSNDELDDNLIISEEAYNRFKNEYGKE